MSHPRAVTVAMAAAAELDPADLPALRRRTLWVLFAGVALGSTGYIAATTVGTLVAAELGGGAALAGIPTAAAVLGTAAATSFLSAFMLRSGRRPGLMLGLGVGALGALLAVLAVIVGSIPLLLAGSALAGFANGAGQLSRYVAADLAAPERRASSIGTVVWGATIGAVVGPNLIAPAGVVASAIGLPALAGAYTLTLLFSIVAVVLAAILLRPEPYALADASALEMRAEGEAAPSVSELLRHPPVALALVTLVAGQVVMVLIMTMTPLHIQEHGHGLTTVGIVLSAHMLGMFALSPISGRLTDRFGSPAIIAAGLATLGAAALIAALAPPDDSLILTLALFLLGYGWNLGFVAGSAMLTRGLALAERTRVQGLTDGLIWSSAAVASMTSGLVVAGFSYTALGLLGLALLVGPAILLFARGPALRQTA